MCQQLDTVAHELHMRLRRLVEKSDKIARLHCDIDTNIPTEELKQLTKR